MGESGDDGGGMTLYYALFLVGRERMFEMLEWMSRRGSLFRLDAREVLPVSSPWRR
jgi:hypothetical protein